MNRKFFFILAALSPSLAATAQPVPIARAHYAAINKILPSCRIVKTDLSGYSTEGGQLTAYLKHGQPQKLVAKFYGESGRATEEYYFWQGKLFFELRTDYDYQFHIMNPKAPGKITSRQERFYLRDGKLVRWFSDGNKSNDLKSTAARQAEMDICKYAREFLAKAQAGHK